MPEQFLNYSDDPDLDFGVDFTSVLEFVDGIDTDDYLTGMGH